MALPIVEIPHIGLPVITLDGVSWVANDNGGSHEHDYIGNWLWDDGSCILWDDGAVMAL